MLQATLSSRFEGIQARRDRFNHAFKAHLDHLGSQEFGSFSKRSRAGEHHQSTITPTHDLHEISDGWTARTFRQIGSPAAVEGLED